MTEEKVDWELKDRRIAWMNMNSACAEILSARINMGIVKHKSNFEAVHDLLDMIQVEMESFMKINSGDKVKDDIGSGRFFCTDCQCEVTDKVRDYSDKKFGRVLCYDCQKGK